MKTDRNLYAVCRGQLRAAGAARDEPLGGLRGATIIITSGSIIIIMIINTSSSSSVIITATTTTTTTTTTVIVISMYTLIIYAFLLSSDVIRSHRGQQACVFVSHRAYVTHTHTYVYIYIYICTYVPMYIYIYIQRERERQIERERHTYVYIYICIYAQTCSRNMYATCRGQLRATGAAHVPRGRRRSPGGLRGA